MVCSVAAGVHAGRKERGEKLIYVGDIVSNAVVLAVHTQENGQAVILAYAEHKSEYVVWSADAAGIPFNGVYRYDQQEAMNKYVERIMAKLFTYYNMIPPTYTYERKNTQ